MAALPAEVVEAAEKTRYWERTDDQSVAVADVLECAAELIERTAHSSVELQAWLTDRGLSVGLLLDMKSEALDWNGSLTTEGRAHLRTLFLAGLEPTQIARIFDVEQYKVDAQVGQFSPHAPEILRLHAQGRTLGQIARELNIPRTTAQTIVEKSGAAPHREHVFVPAQVRARVVELLNDGAPTRDICNDTGLETYQVKNIKRAARKAGQLP